ncbi:MAG: methyltransferase domain-containing protein [Patescibacteria group bacterium]|jgi:SAM-dependent methyltransferase
MSKSNREYRNSHLDPKIVNYYEHTVYGHGSSYSLLWNLEKSILLKIFKKYNLQNNSTTYLDFACGTGRVISFLEDKVRNSFGIDVSQNMINLALPKLHRSKLMVVDLASDDKLLDEKYDLITAFRFFLNSQPELRKTAMNILGQKLSTNGLLIFNIHGNTICYRFPIVILYRLFGKPLQQMTYFQVKNLVHQNGLKIVGYYGVGFIPKFLYPIFPKTWIMTFEKILSKTLLKYLCLDMIFVCKKNE